MPSAFCFSCAVSSYRTKSCAFLSWAKSLSPQPSFMNDEAIFEMGFQRAANNLFFGTI
jgi:hypothetical protein